MKMFSGMSTMPSQSASTTMNAGFTCAAKSCAACEYDVVVMGAILLVSIFVLPIIIVPVLVGVVLHVVLRLAGVVNVKS